MPDDFRTSPTTSDHFRRLPTAELLRRLPTISVDFRLPNFSDDFRPFPMTSDFRTIVPQRNQSEGSQTIHLICMTVGTKLTPNAADKDNNDIDDDADNDDNDDDY